MVRTTRFYISSLTFFKWMNFLNSRHIDCMWVKTWQRLNSYLRVKLNCWKRTYLRACFKSILNKREVQKNNLFQRITVIFRHFEREVKSIILSSCWLKPVNDDNEKKNLFQRMPVVFPHCERKVKSVALNLSWNKLVDDEQVKTERMLLGLKYCCQIERLP